MKYYYDIVWTDYQYEKNLTTSQMQEKEHVDEMIRRVDHMKWQDEQRDKWMNDRNQHIVETNRKYCWRQAWITNIFWFLCNIGIWLMLRSQQTPSDTFWNGL